MMIVILPWPPSVNRMWRSVSGRMLLSAEGRKYRKDGLAALVPVLLGYGQFLGPIRVDVAAHYPDARKRDLDNLLKAPLDLLTHAGVWRDDSQIESLSIWKVEIDKDAPRLVVSVDVLGALPDNRPDH